MSGESSTLGLDLGASKLQVCLVDSGGKVRFHRRLPSPSHLDPATFFPWAERVTREVRQEAGAFDALGLGFPGLVDSARGLARSSVMLPGWEDVPLAENLEGLVGVPCRVDNDANNFARAEVAGRKSPADGSLLFVAVGTGIGGAVCLERRVWNGSCGLAGEIGHLCLDGNGPPCGCGSRGCLNLYASGRAIEDRLGLEAGGLARGEHLAHPDGEAVLRGAAVALGQALAGAQNLLNLPLVVLGGGVPELGEPYRQEVEASFQRFAFPEIAAATRIELAKAGYQGGAIGAALLGREALEG